MPDMMPMSFVAAVAPRTSKFIKNGLNVFERRENLLQNGISHFVFRFSQLSSWKVRNYLDEKPTFLKEAWH